MTEYDPEFEIVGQAELYSEPLADVHSSRNTREYHVPNCLHSRKDSLKWSSTRRNRLSHTRRYQCSHNVLRYEKRRYEQNTYALERFCLEILTARIVQQLSKQGAIWSGRIRTASRVVLHESSVRRQQTGTATRSTSLRQLKRKVVAIVTRGERCSTDETKGRIQRKNQPINVH